MTKIVASGIVKQNVDALYVEPIDHL